MANALVSIGRFVRTEELKNHRTFSVLEFESFVRTAFSLLNNCRDDISVINIMAYIYYSVRDSEFLFDRETKEWLDALADILYSIFYGNTSDKEKNKGISKYASKAIEFEKQLDKMKTIIRI